MFTRTFVSAAVALTLAAVAAATTVVPLDDAALARGAATIVHGDVLSREAFVAAEGGRIYTEYRFAVRELLKGAAETDGTVVFREWGGEVGGVRYWVPGVRGYAPGEEVIAFLGAPDARTGVGLTYGLAQGKFVVRRDAATGRATVERRLAELRMVRPGAAPAADGDGDSAARDLDAFKATIKAELRK